MKIKKGLNSGVAAAGIAMLLAAVAVWPSEQQSAGAAVRIDADDIGGVVTSAHGPEAGVWVIAETTDLPTKFVRIVVTDDRGRYVLPDLPKIKTTPGKIHNLKAVLAPSPAAAAEYYSAIYWFSMLRIPDKSEFPGTGPKGNGIPAAVKSQGEWLTLIKTLGCSSCHQLGNKATRTFPKGLGEFKSSADAWARRVQSGQAMGSMLDRANRLGAIKTLAMFADWSDRIAAGELPASKPSRPQGVERNVVITMWDWSRPKAYLHDEIATDKRNPTVNANGLLYGAPEFSTDFVPVLDPVRHTAIEIKHPVRDPNTPSAKTDPMASSPYWGEEAIWDGQSFLHNPMLDEQARVWFTARIRPPENPPFCRKGSNHPSAKIFPLEKAQRHLSMYDPKTKKFTLIDTCFPTHHLMFAEDANHTLWTSSGLGGGAGVVGWLNRKMFEDTGDEQKSQGWTPFILDTNGNGKRDEWVEPNQPIDPAKDKRFNVNLYSVGVNPVDGSIWGTAPSNAFPGYILRLDPGPNPTETALTEIFEPPFPGYGTRGGDIDHNGVFWAPLASGHLASFDRRKCKGPLNGPTATGKHCPEGWTLYPFPGPQFQNVTDPGTAQASYYAWVDQFDTFGLGKNVPFATGNGTDSLEALVDGKFVTLRVPYPLGFNSKGLDGRIDDPQAGWKGKGLWSTYAGRAPFHIEGGKGTTSKVVKFQLRPDPLAK